jgi:iron(III) transport system substrate-binding protein
MIEKLFTSGHPIVYFPKTIDRPSLMDIEIRSRDDPYITSTFRWGMGMSTFCNRYIISVVLLAFVSWLSAIDSTHAQAPNIAAAKKEGRVVVYGIVVPQAMAALHKGFEKKYGITVDYWRGSATKVMDRALNEWRAGKSEFDVVDGTQGAQVLLKQDSIFAKYFPPASENFKDQFKDKDGLITPWRIPPVAVLYNTTLVAPREVPRSLDDLLDPRWKKKITIPDPTQHTSTAQFLWNLRKIKGQEWLSFVRALAKQEPHLVESYSPVPNALVSGEAVLGIAYIKYVKQFKGPIAYAPMEQYLTEPSYLGLSSRASHPNAGRLYIEYACSPEGQKIVAEDGEFVLYPGIFPPIQDAEKVGPKIILMDNATEKDLKDLSVRFREIFYAK